MDTEAREKVRKASRKIFGADYRLEITASLHAGDLVTISDMAERLGNPPGEKSVNVEFKKLETLGLLERLPKTAGNRHVYLRPIDVPLWDACRDLEARAIAGALVEVS